MKIVTMVAVAIFIFACRVAGQVPALDLFEGRLVREIHVSPGVRSSTEEIVRRHLASRQGEPFHRATLQEDHRRLDALRLFSSIAIQPVAAGDDVVLQVDVNETLRLLPFMALSDTDENGVSAGPGFRSINLFGGGALASGTMQFGGATTIGLRAERPTVTPGAWDLDTKIVYRSRRNELFDFDETSATVAAVAGWNWTNRVQVGGRGEFVRIDTGESDIALSPDGTDQLPEAGVFLTYNSLDSMSNPRTGWLASVDVGRLFGDAGSWTTMFDGRRLQPISARSTLSLVAFGAFQSGIVGRDLPEYLQVGIGGANSVRGWSLASRVGKNQLIGTVEYLYSVVPVRPFKVFGLNLYGGIQGAAFSDLGMAWSDRFEPSRAIDGYGVGLRLLFPFVDVLRVDLAFGEPGAGTRLSIGINLKADKQHERVR
jgi:outer membrane protein assembly factor BamA